jgi:hypothetical protein
MRAVSQKRKDVIVVHVAMVVTWKQPFPGRETKALEYGAEVQAFWHEQAVNGTCSEPELFFGSSGVGMWMVKGDAEALLAVWNSEPSRRLLAKGVLLLGSFGYESMMTGESADQYMGDYAASAGALGLM